MGVCSPFKALVSFSAWVYYLVVCPILLSLLSLASTEDVLSIYYLVNLQNVSVIILSNIVKPCCFLLTFFLAWCFWHLRLRKLDFLFLPFLYEKLKINEEESVQFCADPCQITSRNHNPKSSITFFTFFCRHTGLKSVNFERSSVKESL